MGCRGGAGAEPERGRYQERRMDSTGGAVPWCMDGSSTEASRGDSGEGPVPRKGRGRRAHRQRVHCRQAEDEDKVGRHPSSRPALAAAASAATAFAADFHDSCSGVRSMYCHVSPSHRHTLCHTAGAGNLSPLSLPSPLPSPLPLASPFHLFAEIILGVRTSGCLDQERLPSNSMSPLFEWKVPGVR